MTLHLDSIYIIVLVLTVTCGSFLSDYLLSIKAHTKPVPSAVDAGAQIQQMVSIEVLKPFFEPPLLSVKLTLVCMK